MKLKKKYLLYPYKRFKALHRFILRRPYIIQEVTSGDTLSM